MPTSTNTNSNSTTAGRSRFATIATRLGAGVGVSLAALTILGGSAFAESGEPGPTPVIPLTPVEFTPDFELSPIEPPAIDLDDITVIPTPDDDDVDPPVFEVPDFPEFEIPLDIPEIPELPVCVEWDPADVTVSSVENGDLTATVTLAYADPAGVCDELFVVHSTQEDATMTPLALLAEEQVSIADLQADPDSTIAVTVPLDPCYTRVFTHGPEALVLQDDHYGVGCPVDTVPEDTPVETVPETDPTVPPTVPSDPTVPPTVPGSQTLPQTGSPSMVIALLGGALILAGGALAIGVRQSQTSCSSQTSY